MSRRLRVRAVTPAAAFVAELRDLGAPHTMSARDLTRHGLAICTALESIASQSQVRAIMHNARMWPDGSSLPEELTDALGDIVAAAKQHLCVDAATHDDGTPV